MPPHCDSMDGPVVTAARSALEKGNVELALPFVKKESENEVLGAFEKALAVREMCEPAQEIADLYFFETVVRLHREGEGAEFTGIKPAGLDVGPVIPIAEEAIETGDADHLETILCEEIKHQIHHRLEEAMRLKKHVDEGVDQAREYVEAMLGFQVWSHKLFITARSSPHEGGHGHG